MRRVGSGRPHDAAPERTRSRASRTAAPGSPFAPGVATRFYGYGYQTWLFPPFPGLGERRQFALLGVHGQAVFVDLPSKLVLVHTAVRPRPSGDPMGPELNALWTALVRQYGR